MALHRNYTRRGDIVASMDISTEVEYLGKDKNAIYFVSVSFLLVKSTTFGPIKLTIHFTTIF